MGKKKAKELSQQLLVIDRWSNSPCESSLDNDLSDRQPERKSSSESPEDSLVSRDGLVPKADWSVLP